MMSSPSGVDNLDAHAQSVQLRFGAGVLMAALLAGVAMDRFGAKGAARLALLPLFFLGVYGISAGLVRTCAFTALFGRRRTATGTEPIADRRELAIVRRQGVVVMASSLIVSVLACLLLAVAH